MDAAVTQATIFVPMIVVVALTLIAFLRMAGARARVAKEGIDANYYRAFLGPPEPAYAIVAVRHYGNLMEAPTVFYAGAIVAFILSAVTPWTLLFAWGFVAMRLVQSFIHLTYNNPLHRGLSFVVSWLFLVALWVVNAMAVLREI